MTLSGLACTGLQIYWWVIFAAILLSWFPVPSDHPVGVIKRGVDALTQPLLSPIRRLIPPLRLGHAALDLSPIVLLLAVRLLSGVVCR